MRERNPHLLAALSELPGKPEARCKASQKSLLNSLIKLHTDEPDPEWPDVFWHLWRAFLYDHLEKVPRTAKRLLGIWKSEAVCISTDEGQTSMTTQEKQKWLADLAVEAWQEAPAEVRELFRSANDLYIAMQRLHGIDPALISDMHVHPHTEH
ncbi:hypothetical protein [Thiohalophilus sp.]|uniref:hypothetical protein n=1 Tax=Thiohalophilus sp. TaxID=3028392 RepID=UPI002ACE03D5|nr:hypothetical protein [Thiohalophilus sp.]MDZ7804303.1 hypothetical protein [Thiohalophilus sp.]